MPHAYVHRVRVRDPRNVLANKYLKGTEAFKPCKIYIFLKSKKKSVRRWCYYYNIIGIQYERYTINNDVAIFKA